MNNLNDFVNASYKNAVEHGWWEEERSFGDLIALIHSELSEALEDYRNGYKPTEIYYENGVKPCGVPTELADVLIRIFDLCGRYGIDLDAVVKEKMEYNRTRPFRHGNKKM
jgi:NTP pyrophosphatase (non-canonical NTP hydrolase)